MNKNGIGWFIFLLLLCWSTSFALAAPDASDASTEASVESLSADKTALITGKVTWEGHNLAKVTVQVYKDDKLKEPYGGSIVLNDKGEYNL